MKVRFEGVKRSDPTQDNGARVSYAPAKRAAFRGRWYLMLLLVISPIIAFGWLVTREELLVRADGILTTKPVVYSASQSGFVTDVVAGPGTLVDVGADILELRSPEIDRKIELWKANAALLTAHQEAAAAQLREVLETHRERLEASDADHRKIAAKYAELEQKGLFTLSDQVLLNAEQRELLAEIKDLDIEVERAEAMHVTDATANEIREIELQIAIAEVQQKELDLTAKLPGVVNRILVREGEYVSEGEELAEVSNFDQPVVEVYLRPERMNYAQVGKSVTVVLPDRSRHSGEIRDPAQIADTIPPTLAGPFDGARRAIRVTVHLDTPPENWVEGLPVEVRF